MPAVSSILVGLVAKIKRGTDKTSVNRGKLQRCLLSRITMMTDTYANRCHPDSCTRTLAPYIRRRTYNEKGREWKLINIDRTSRMQVDCVIMRKNCNGSKWNTS